MGSESSVSDLVRKVSKTGAEMFLFYGNVVTKPDGRLSAELQAEVLSRSKDLRTFLASQIASSRSSSGLTHKWVIRLGDMKPRPLTGVLRPAYLACGPRDWCMRMIRQAQELSDPANKYERSRWLILEQDQVGAPIKDARGVLVASIVALPEGVSLGGPTGSSAEIVSGCDSCLTTPIADDKVAEIVKNDD